MKVASVSALAASLFFASAYAGPQVPGGTVPAPAPASSAAYLVDGKLQNGLLITPPNPGQVYERLEIRQLQKNTNQWNLFLLATQAWQKEAQVDGTDSGYYGVSRIHGLPFGVFNNATGPPGSGGGYCPHSTVIFPSWHRVYVATYEQQLLARAFKIANSWTGTSAGADKSSMLAAAAQLRMPYWDWAMIPETGTNSMPDSIASLKIDMVQTDGTLKQVDNPLAAFKFRDLSVSAGMQYAVIKDWISTMRYPSSNAQDAYSRPSDLVATFSRNQKDYQDKVYQLLHVCKTYAYFATDKADQSDASCSNSLEGIHNLVHNDAGGQGWQEPNGYVFLGGHMTYLTTASYDPLFWLHHANVDRLFALWQGLNSEYGATAMPGNPTMAFNTSVPVGPTTPLMPFLKDANNASSWWTTDEVEHYDKTFGYTYPELKQTDLDLTAQIELLYGANAQAGGRMKRSIASYAPAGKAAAPSAIDNSKLATNGSEYQFNANIQTPRHALGTSYSIFIFIGEPAAEDPSTWASDANLAGQMGILGDVPGSDMHMNEVIVSGSVPLTRTMHKRLESGELKSMAPEDANAYLKANLKWKISVLGRCVDPATLEGFVVSVVSTTVVLPTDISQPPVYSPFHPIVDITAGIAGGLNATTKLLGDVVDDVKDCVTDVVSDVAKGDVGGVVDSVVGGVKDTLGSLTSGLSNIGKAFTAPAAAAKAPSSASTY